MRTPLLLSYYKYGFFVLSGAWTIAKKHEAKKLLFRACKAVFISLVYDAVYTALNGSMPRENALRTHSLVFAAASGATPFLTGTHGCVCLMMIMHVMWTFDAPLALRYPQALGHCFDVPFAVDGCTNIGSNHPSLCGAHGAECSQRVHRTLRGVTINANTQWTLGYRICDSTVCTWQPTRDHFHTAVFGGLGFIPCSYAFVVGALYEHAHRSTNFIRVFFALGVCLLLLIAYADGVMIVEDLFMGDPVSTFMLSAVACFHVHCFRMDRDECRACGLVRWCARHSACIYACQPFLTGVDVPPTEALLLLAILVAASASSRRFRLTLNVFIPSTMYLICLSWGKSGC